MTQPTPDGYHSLTPYLVCDGAAAAIDFYVRAFGAEEVRRLPAPDGRVMHATLRIGNSMLMLNDEWPDMGAVGPKKLGGSPVTVHLFVPDVDATMAQAAAAGGRITMPAADMFWGDRFGTLEDPFGHKWSVATHLQDLSTEQMMENMRRFMPGG